MGPIRTTPREEIQLILTTEETNALLRHTRGVARKADLMLTALARATAKWTDSDTVLIDMMGHGRDESIADGVDPLETVGFFISYTPLVLRLPDPGSAPSGDAVRADRSASAPRARLRPAQVHGERRDRTTGIR